MLGTWLGRVVGIGIVAGAIAACGNSTSTDNPPGGDDGGADAHAGESDSSVYEAGSDASPNNENKNDAGECISNCHVDAPCTVASTCASGVCTDSKCADPSCMDGMKDGTETASDCGGVCSACADHLGCVVGGDCISGVCDATTKTCAAPTDMDHVQNGTETDVDCGDSGTGEADNAPACGDGLKCNVAADCLDGLCGANKTCTPASCMDNILNGTETAVDCGGLCPACADTLACKVDADCTSKHCDIGNTNTCLAPTSSDHIANGNETDTDCGSSGTGENTHAGPCPDGEICAKAVDCSDGVCGANLTCAAPTCKDGVQNGGETDIDCGDGIITGCAACGDGKKCDPANSPSDCSSLICNATSKTCTKPTDTDGIQNGKESDVDCGSSGTGPEDTKARRSARTSTRRHEGDQQSAAWAPTASPATATRQRTSASMDSLVRASDAVGKASGIQDISVQAVDAKVRARTRPSPTTPTRKASARRTQNGKGLYSGIDTCGVGEATDSQRTAARALESCCKSLDVAVTGEVHRSHGQVRGDRRSYAPVRRIHQRASGLQGLTTISTSG